MALPKTPHTRLCRTRSFLLQNVGASSSGTSALTLAWRASKPPRCSPKWWAIPTGVRLAPRQQHSTVAPPHLKIISLRLSVSLIHFYICAFCSSSVRYDVEGTVTSDSPLPFVSLCGLSIQTNFPNCFSTPNLPPHPPLSPFTLFRRSESGLLQRSCAVFNTNQRSPGMISSFISTTLEMTSCMSTLGLNTPPLRNSTIHDLDNNKPD